MATFEFLGRLSDQFGADVTADVPDNITTLAELRPWLNAHFETGVFSHPAIRIIMDGRVVLDEEPFKNSDRLALFPPVGGG